MLLCPVLLAGILLYPGSAFCSDEDIYIENISYPKVFKGISIKLNVSEGAMTVLSGPKKVAGYPNFYPGAYKFCARIFSSDGKMLGEYGFRDPRIVQGERGYTGPTKLESVDITLIIPYFENAKSIKIFSGNAEVLSIEL